MPPKKKAARKREAKSYRHTSATLPLRPDVGTQAQFKKKKPPATYRYDSSISPALDWDGQNPAREEAEALIKTVVDAATLEEARNAGHKLMKVGKPFLNWAGKAERFSFSVPTLPLFVHERLSTKAIIETLRGHRRESAEQMALFADPQHPIADQVLRAYEHQDEWVNRMVLGDSLVVMNSLLHYENLGGQVQMIYMDPPYGVRFGSNFQPFVRKRDVKHNDDDDMTREPEMVQAYRDTWELGLHSYLTYLRDRLLLCRELLAPSGSIFVQISDENLHHVRELLDEVFGAANYVTVIAFTKAPGGLESTTRLSSRIDYLLWYAKNREEVVFQPLFEQREDPIEDGFDMAELPSGERRRLDREERRDPKRLPSGARLAMSVSLTKPGPGSKYDVQFNGRTYDSGKRWWGMPKESLLRLIEKKRVIATEKELRFFRYLDDFPYRNISNLWTGLAGASNPVYVVQTNDEVIKRCVLMTTRPGDLILDPTCGSGTTAYVAEHWGRRWVTIEVSRVPLALARQRILTATFPWYTLQDADRGPSGGFGYEKRGIVARVTPSAIANEEPPLATVLLDRPDEDSKITRVSGPFTFEATIPTPVDWEGDGQEDSGTHVDHAAFEERMLEVLRRSPVLRLQGNKTVTFSNIRPPAKTLTLSAEAAVGNGEQKVVAFVFGPENGAISQKLVYEAAREAHLRNYAHLYVIGFGIQSAARELVDKCASVVGLPATYVEAARDLQMGDLLKNMRSSQIFSVCGLPEIRVHKAGDGKYQVELIGLDVLDPVTMELDSRKADDVPAWFLDADYNELCFHVSQAFFPRTSAWENVKKALRADYADTVWDHLAGTKSAPFEEGDHGQIAVKVIDDRGNELLVVKKLSEAKR